MGLHTEHPLPHSSGVRHLGRRAWLLGFVASTAIVLLGVDFGRLYLLPGPWVQPGDALLDLMVNFDGGFFRGITQQGYTYTPGQASAVHFFPLYPLLAWLLKTVTGCSAALALIVLAQAAFAAALFLLGRYIERRYGPEADAVRNAALFTLSFVPAGIFFHMGYTESLFLLLLVAHLDLIERGGHPLGIALVVGLATATRAVGVALVLPLGIYLFRWARTPGAFVAWSCLCLPLALSGLLGFGIYCQWAFGDAFATVRDRAALWSLRPLVPLPEKLLILGTLRPVWEIFLPASPSFWGHYVIRAQLPFSLYVANPLYFLTALGLVGAGWAKRWLNAYETSAALGLLLIPYWNGGYEAQMVSMARYVVVVAPLYLVAGRLLAKLPPLMRGCMLGVSGVFLAVYAALFARWYWMV